MGTMSQPFFSSRKWIKVWINEWREGTLRWQATDSQRAFWIDLLALAGRSRYPGIVCAGKDDNRIIGYPATFLSPNSGITSDNIAATLDLFKSKGMVTYQVSKSVQGDDLYAVTITNWKKYQSDYEANKVYQRNYRARKKASSQSTDSLTSQLVERKPLEQDSEVEKDKEEEKSAAFAIFWSEYPRQEKPLRAKYAWHKANLDERAPEVMASLIDWKRSEQWSDKKFIPYAVNWLEEGLWKQNPVNAARKLSKHEQSREVTKSAAARVRSEIESGRMG